MFFGHGLRFHDTNTECVKKPNLTDPKFLICNLFRLACQGKVRWPLTVAKEDFNENCKRFRLKCILSDTNDCGDVWQQCHTRNVNSYQLPPFFTSLKILNASTSDLFSHRYERYIAWHAFQFRSLSIALTLFVMLIKSAPKGEIKTAESIPHSTYISEIKMYEKCESSREFVASISRVYFCLWL